jgi:hypothetical protein
MAAKSIWVILAVSGILFGGRAIAQENGDKPAKSDKKVEKGEKKGKHTWAVLKVGDEFRVVQEDKIADLQKDLDKEAKDKEKDKGHKKGKKSEPKKIVKIKLGFATQTDAEKYRDDLIAAKDKKKGDKSDAKKTAKKE